MYDAIITDEEWLWQMLLNLLTNACKYTDKGSIKVAVSLSDEQAFAAPAPAFSLAMTTTTTTTERFTGFPQLSVRTQPPVLLFEVIDTGTKRYLPILEHLPIS